MDLILSLLLIYIISRGTTIIMNAVAVKNIITDLANAGYKVDDKAYKEKRFPNSTQEKLLAHIPIVNILQALLRITQFQQKPTNIDAFKVCGVVKKLTKEEMLAMRNNVVTSLGLYSMHLVFGHTLSDDSENPEYVAWDIKDNERHIISYYGDQNRDEEEVLKILNYRLVDDEPFAMNSFKPNTPDEIIKEKLEQEFKMYYEYKDFIEKHYDVESLIDKINKEMTLGKKLK